MRCRPQGHRVLQKCGTFAAMSVPAAPIRTVVAGVGYIGSRHAALVHAHPAFELVGVAEPAPDRAATATAFGAPVYPTLAASLAVAPELVVVAAPNDRHIPLALEALAQGCHVAVEKPLGLTQASCQALVTAALGADRQVFVVVQNRFTPTAQWLKGLLEGGHLGRILLAQIGCYWNRDHRYYTPGHWHGTLGYDGGALFTQFSHFIDLLLWLLGDAQVQAATVANLHHRGQIEIDDSGTATFGLAGGGLGALSYTTAVWDRNLESRLLLLGERGSVVLGGQYFNRIEACHIEGYTLPTLPEANPPNHYGGYQGSAANHGHVYDNIYATLRQGGAPACTATEGLRVTAFIEELYRVAGYPGCL